MRKALAVSALLWVVVCASEERTVASQANRWRVWVDGLYGFIDAQGRMVVPPQYKSAGSFSGDLAFVEFNDGLRGYIKPDGEMAFLFRTEEGDCCQGFHDGLAPIRQQDKLGFINLKGEVVIAPRFEAVRDFSHGAAPAKVDGMWGIIDRKGDWVVEPSYRLLMPFSEGIAAAKTHDKKWGFLDTKGKVLIPFNLKSAADFCNGVAFVASDEERLLIKTTGQVITKIPPHLKIRPFFQSLAAAENTNTGKWGYVNMSLQVEVPFRFDDCSDFSEGLAAVHVDGKWGYLNRQGKMVILPKFVECQGFENGRARVELEENRENPENPGILRGGGAIIDKEGQIIWPKRKAQAETPAEKK